MIKVYRYRVKSLNGLLNKQARAVSYVWNPCPLGWGGRQDMEVKLLSINNGVPAMTIDRSEIESIHRVGGRVDGDALIRG